MWAAGADASICVSTMLLERRACGHVDLTRRAVGGTGCGCSRPSGRSTTVAAPTAREFSIDATPTLRIGRVPLRSPISSTGSQCGVGHWMPWCAVVAVYGAAACRQRVRLALQALVDCMRADCMLVLAVCGLICLCFSPGLLLLCMSACSLDPHPCASHASLCHLNTVYPSPSRYTQKSSMGWAARRLPRRCARRI